MHISIVPERNQSLEVFHISYDDDQCFRHLALLPCDLMYLLPISSIKKKNIMSYSAFCPKCIVNGYFGPLVPSPVQL